MNLGAMKILFADYSSPEEHARKEIDPSVAVAGNPKRSRFDVLVEQCINSAIVAGVAALASGGDPWVALKAFGLVFLLEMRKYRKL